MDSRFISSLLLSSALMLAQCLSLFHFVDHIHTGNPTASQAESREQAHSGSHVHAIHHIDGSLEYRTFVHTTNLPAIDTAIDTDGEVEAISCLVYHLHGQYSAFLPSPGIQTEYAVNYTSSFLPDQKYYPSHTLSNLFIRGPPALS